jgi:hypothetical protein
MSMCSTTDNPERKTAWRPLARLALLLAVLMAAPAQAVPLVVERLLAMTAGSTAMRRA